MGGGGYDLYHMVYRVGRSQPLALFALSIFQD